MGNLKVVFAYLGGYQMKKNARNVQQSLRDKTKINVKKVHGEDFILYRNSFPNIQESYLKMKWAGLGANEFSSA